jgi:L-ectoine synthase
MASLVLEGDFEITDKASGRVHRLSDGDLYCVRPGETHSLHAIGDTHMISVFNPPLTGTERLDASGGYPDAP